MFAKSDIEKYFAAEKGESIVFMIVGIAALLLGCWFFWFIKTGFYKGAAIPLLLVGLLLGIVGYTVYSRCDADRTRNVYAYDMNPQQLKEKEIPRMEKVMKNFVAYTYIEVALALAGIGLFVYFRHNAANVFWKGFGCTLAIMALITLGADYFAEKRGEAYLKGLQEWVNSKR